jgi:hypothetical protein
MKKNGKETPSHSKWLPGSDDNKTWAKLPENAVDITLSGQSCK